MNAALSADGTLPVATQLTFGTPTSPGGVNNLAHWGELRDGLRREHLGLKRRQEGSEIAADPRARERPERRTEMYARVMTAHLPRDSPVETKEPRLPRRPEGGPGL